MNISIIIRLTINHTICFLNSSYSVFCVAENNAISPIIVSITAIIRIPHSTFFNSLFSHGYLFFIDLCFSIFSYDYFLLLLFLHFLCFLFSSSSFVSSCCSFSSFCSFCSCSGLFCAFSCCSSISAFCSFLFFFLALFVYFLASFFYVFIWNVCI